jgi:hypothetical protein
MIQASCVGVDQRMLRWQAIAVRFAEWLDLGCHRSDPAELVRRLVKVLAEVGEVHEEAAADIQNQQAIAGEAADVVFAALVATISLPGFSHTDPPRAAFDSLIPDLPATVVYQPLAVDRQAMRLAVAGGRLAETIAGNQRKGNRFTAEAAHLHLAGTIAAALLLIARVGADPADELERCAAKLERRLDAARRP